MYIRRFRLLFCLCFMLNATNFVAAQGGLQNLQGLSGASQFLSLMSLNSLPSVNISQRCQNATQAFVEDLLTSKQWAVEMFDASGKPGEGILNGHIHWLGSYDECMTMAVNQSEASSVTGSQYCTVSAAIPENLVDLKTMFILGGSKPLVKLDLCLPSDCTDDEILLILNSSASTFGLDINSVDCQKPIGNLLEDKAVIVAIVLLSLFAVLIITGTTLDVICVLRTTADWTVLESSQKKSKTNLELVPMGDKSTTNGHLRMKNDHTSSTNGYFPTTNGHLPEKGDQTRIYTLNHSTKVEPLDSGGYLYKPWAEDKENEIAVQDTKTTTVPMVFRIFQTFSLRQNVERVFDTSQPTGSLGCLNGIRVLSMGWVILGHVYALVSALGNNGLANLKDAGNALHSIYTQSILNGTLSVDSFFLLSGLLVAYLFCRDFDKSGRRLGWKKMAYFYFHRFWRLTPFYMLILLVYTAFFKYMRNGPLWPETFVDSDKCRETWWHNMLYVNNLVPSSYRCMGVTWYLANDMQFYVLSPLVLIPLVKRPVIGWLGLVLLVLTHVVTTAGLVVKVGGDVLSAPDYNTEIYIKPYCRVGVYAVGMCLGYMLHRGKTVRLSKLLCLICWILALTLIVALNHVSYTHNKLGAEPWPLYVTAIYEAIKRIVWAIALSWVIFACRYGYGGFINSILSWKAWIPLTRLTYGAYLLHPTIMAAHEFSRRVLFYYRAYNMAYLFVSSFFISYGVAFLFSVTLEMPLVGLEKLLLGNKLKSRR